MDEVTEQARIPGVRYRKITRYRSETTVIDGVPSTRRVAYDDWEPVPPREWDEMILRGVTGLAVVVTLIAFAGTTASAGGLLSHMVHGVFAYGMGLVSTSVWVACLAVGWLLRIDPDRARAAKVAGWAALLISMGAAFTAARVGAAGQGPSSRVR
ncbi:hypothetical protein ACNPQM_24005 [Streptomyces sp. NPDC056231]|uniref:hypothetical protein n=1 Tax=Streptomyces sp. NPDC056231 TaxID=3345755 RepID=UPI003AAADFAA